jgi:Mce-associated membrane protein
MAVDADATVHTLDGSGSEPTPSDDVNEAEKSDDGARPSGQVASDSIKVGTRRAAGRRLVVSATIVAVLAGLTAWLGYQTYQSSKSQQRHNLFLTVARQGALNLTTISYADAGADVARILDSATGGFRDEFQQRSQSFIALVNKAQSKSVGTIIEAGVESEQDNEARVLVAVNVDTSLAGTPEPKPRAWRMRLIVQRIGDGAKISNVEFVP